MKTAVEAREVLANLKKSIKRLEELADQAPSTAIYSAIDTCKDARRVIKRMIIEFGEEGTHMPTPVEDPTIPRIEDSGEIPVHEIPAARVEFDADHADETEDLPARVRDLAKAVLLLARGHNATAIPAALAVIAALEVSQ